MTNEFSGPTGSPAGLLNLNKPIGITSRDAVNVVSRRLRKIKVGHAGTLDPLASGVLVLCVGSATRLIEYVQRMRKTYRAVIRLGATSDTLDADGQIAEIADAPIPSRDNVASAIQSQIGLIEQIPPQFSALKVEGRRAYDLARAGHEVALAARTVEIHGIVPISYEWPRLELEVVCGSGTYIRSIARDLGERLGCGGLIEVLTRTRIGGFRIEDAVDPKTLDDRDAINAHLLAPTTAVGDLPRLTLDERQLGDVRQGRALSIDQASEGESALLGPDGTLVAIAEYDATNRTMSPRRVFLA